MRYAEGTCELPRDMTQADRKAGVVATLDVLTTMNNVYPEGVGHTAFAADIPAVVPVLVDACKVRAGARLDPLPLSLGVVVCVCVGRGVGGLVCSDPLVLGDLLQDTAADVKQSAFALLGELVQCATDAVVPHLPSLISPLSCSL
jgi:hypothetical protein